MLKTFAKLRRAPYRVREKLTAVITIAVVVCITVVWFFFFLFSLLSKDFIKTPSEAGSAEVPAQLEAPFSE